MSNLLYDHTLEAEYIEQLRKEVALKDPAVQAEPVIRSRRLHQIPFPPIPAALIGVIDVVIPGVGRDGEETVVVSLTPLVASEYGNVCRPVFMSVSLPDLGITELGHVSSYMHAWAEYLRDQLSALNSMTDRLKQQLKWATGRLDVDLAGLGLKPGERKSRITLHPVVAPLDADIAMCAQLRISLTSNLKSVTEQMQHASRELTRRGLRTEVAPSTIPSPTTPQAGKSTRLADRNPWQR